MRVDLECNVFEAAAASPVCAKNRGRDVRSKLKKSEAGVAALSHATPETSSLKPRCIVNCTVRDASAAVRSSMERKGPALQKLRDIKDASNMVTSHVGSENRKLNYTVPDASGATSQWVTLRTGMDAFRVKRLGTANNILG